MTTAAAYRFEVALSFANEFRNRAYQIANLLAANLGRERILYDEWYKAEFARPNLDEYLPSLYQKQSRLLVFFMSREYKEREWAGLEWRAGRELIKKKESERIMFLRLDSYETLDSIDGYLDIRKLSDKEVADEILTRLSAFAPAPRPTVEQVVDELRAATQEGLLRRCGKIRVLSMERPIDLGGVYTDVLVHPKRTANLRKTKDELVREARSAKSHRLGVSSVEMVRMPGSKLFNHERQIIIFGKPGAGKTTFLKHMATQCALGEFCPDHVPVFVALREYADTDQISTLFQFIASEWHQNQNSLSVLNHGRAVILLDGLDEVRDVDYKRVRRAIEEFAGEFPLCKIALTCRIAAREYTFVNFTEVEMADFNEQQILAFASRWFRAHDEERRADDFVAKLRANESVWELATSPLLLTLLCLVFQELSDFNGSRAGLYKQGLDVLLHKWDARRAIERDFPSGVSRSSLEPLLSEIAYTRYLAGEYFFSRASLEKQISDFFERRDMIPGGAYVDPSRVLNCIEAYLGLLVARAVDVYSFSHLTFQEYLTAQQVVRKPTLLFNIGQYIGQPNWREVWLLLAAALDADEVVEQIKTASDQLVENEMKIQEILEWCFKRARQHNTNNQAALRSFYFGLVLARNRTPDEDPVQKDLDGSRFIELSSDINFRLARALHFDVHFRFDLDRYLTLALHFVRDLRLDRRIDGDVAREIALYGEVAHDVARGLDQVLRHILLICKGFPTLTRELQVLGAELPTSPDSGWVIRDLPAWHDRFRAAMHLSGLDYDWSPDVRQRQLLEDYHRSNLLLVDSMTEAHGLTRDTRRNIEETMLLPYERLHELPPEI